MKIIFLMQYFIVTMVLTITIGLYALKPTESLQIAGVTSSVQIATTNKQFELNKSYQ